VPPRLDDVKRGAILADIEAGQLSRNAIARKHRVAGSTVSAIADEAGIPDAFDRANVESATRARTADMKARRALLAEALLVDVELLRDRAWSKYPQVVNTGDGHTIVDLDGPPLDQVRNAYAAVGIATDKHLALVAADKDTGVEDARSMLGALAAGLGAAYDRLKADEPAASAGPDEDELEATPGE
jgi:predicted homoserine dehydrogenase-like protein